MLEDDNQTGSDSAAADTGRIASSDDISRAKRDLIDPLINAQLHGKNRDVYDKVLIPGTEPDCVFFYYLRIDNSGVVRADHYFYDRGSPIPYVEMENPEGLVKELACNARPSGENKHRMDSNSFVDVVWKRRSYIAIFFDERNWSFHRRVNGNPSIAFDPKGGTPNQSFFDATDLTIEMPIHGTNYTDERSAVFFINHYKDSINGGDLGEVVAQQSYKIDIYLLAKYANANAPAMTVIFDPTGTNVSP